MSDKAEKVEKDKAAEKKKGPPPQKPNILHKDQVIAAESGNRYLVERLLGKGGFGEVFKVSLVSDPEKKFAMKVEPAKAEKKHEMMMRLKIELHVFNTIATTPDSKVDKTHFVKMHDKGRTAKFKYYVMDVISMSLEDVVNKVLDWKISSSTLIKIARQTLKGIEALHELGFLHRDIKAANYAIGLPPKDSIIYMLDFGIARPYLDNKGRVLLPRATVKFLGTVKYASIRCLQKEDQSRKDDLEVWMYMMLELYKRDNLRWREFDRRDGWDTYVKRTIAAKIDLHLRARVMCMTGGLHIPLEFCDIIDNIHDMKYNDVGNFKYINVTLDEIVQAKKINESLPLDWIGKMPAPEEPKKSETFPITPEESKKDEVKKEQKIENAKDETKKDYKTDKKKGKSGSRDIKTKEDKETEKLTIQAMEELKEELRREKRRRSKARTRDDEYDDDEDSEDDDYSEEEEEYRRRRKKCRKRPARGKTRTEDYSDESDRDERDDKRRHRRKSPGGKKRSRGNKKKAYDDKDLDTPRIPEPKDEEKDNVRKKSKDERTVEVKVNEKDVDPKKRDGKTPEVDKEGKDKKDKDKDKKVEDAKKEQKSAAAKPEPEKKTNEATPVKKEPDTKK